MLVPYKKGSPSLLTLVKKIIYMDIHLKEEFTDLF